jgi:hypothetical protein
MECHDGRLARRALEVQVPLVDIRSHFRESPLQQGVGVRQDGGVVKILHSISRPSKGSTKVGAKNTEAVCNGLLKYYIVDCRSPLQMVVRSPGRVGPGPGSEFEQLKVPGLTPGSKDFIVYTKHTVAFYISITLCLTSVKVQASPVTSTESACVTNSDSENLSIFINCTK